MSTPHPHGLVSASDIATLAGVTRGAVSNWRRREDDFPAPTAGTTNRPLYDRTEVLTWLQGRGITVEQDPRLTVWSAMNLLRDELDPESAGQALLGLATNLDTNHPFGPAGLSVKQGAPLLKLLSQVDRDDLGDVVDYSLERLGRAQGRADIGYGAVGSRNSELLARLAATRPGGTLYDPACGIATSLIRAHQLGAAPQRTVGHDSSDDVITIARQRADLHQVAVDLDVTDVLAEDYEPDLRADTVIAEPPFGLRLSAAAQLVDPRFADLPPRYAEFGWMRHALTHLAEDGRAFVLTHSGMLHWHAVQQARIDLVTRGNVEAVVALPAGMVPHTNMTLALWVLRPDTTDTDTVTMLDAADIDDPETVIPQWLTDPAQRPDQVSATVKVTDLLGENCVLDPSRWVFDSPDDTQVAATYAAGRDAINTGYQHIGQAIEAFTQAATGFAPPQQTQIHTIKTLIDAGVLEQIRRPALRAEDLPDTARTQIIGGRDIQNRPVLDTPPATNWPGARTDLTQPGDVLISTIAGRQDSTVIASLDKTGEHPVSRSITVLRVTNHDLLLPEYLARMLRGSWNTRFQQGSTIPRVDIRALEIPLPPLETQRQICQTATQLDQLTDHIASITAGADQVTNALLDATRYNTPLA